MEAIRHQVVGMQVQNMGRGDKKDKGKNTKLNLRVNIKLNLKKTASLTQHV